MTASADTDTDTGTGSAAAASSTRAHLLDVAAERFAATGYDATSISDLVEASGLSRGAFYFHFDSKRDLALEVFRDRQQRLQARVMARVDGDLPGLARFRQLWLERARVLAEDPSLRCLRKIAPAFGDDPDLQEEFAELHQGPIRLLTGMLAEAKAHGDLREDLDPAAAAEVAFTMVLGLDDLSERESGMSDLVERSRAALDVLLRGMVPS